MPALTLPSSSLAMVRKLPQSFTTVMPELERVRMNDVSLMLTQATVYNEQQRIIGLVLHDLLSHASTWPLPASFVSKDALIALWRKNGGDPSGFDAALKELGRLLFMLQQSTHAKRIFDSDAKVVWREKAFYVPKHRGVRKIVMDRVIQHPDGTWWVIEFKSMHQKSLSKEQEHDYYAQVQDYIQVLTNYLNTTVRGSLYFIADDSIVDIEPTIES